MRTTSNIFAALGITALLACAPAWAAEDFTSDGCSLFPDGTIKDRAQWCECCLGHDIAYWRGGTEDERRKADEELRACVLKRTQDNALAETMYLGVRAGGHPVFPAWYRWAYGWPYGRGYQSLNDEEQKEIRKKLDAYGKDHPAGYCVEKHMGKERGDEK